MDHELGLGEGIYVKMFDFRRIFLSFGGYRIRRHHISDDENNKKIGVTGYMNFDLSCWAQMDPCHGVIIGSFLGAKREVSWADG